MTKAKVKPKSFIVAGPAYLVIEDVPLPIALPFGYFPFSDKYSSGVIMPSYGDDFTRGFNLHNGGYYFALSDYADLALTGDIYTKGTWAVNGMSSYVKRYKYRGNLNFSYRNDVIGEKGMPDYSSSSSMKIFNLPQCREVGLLKNAIKEAILDGEIPNEYDAAYRFLMAKAVEVGIKKQN